MTPIPEAAKAYVALIGAIATALLGVFTADTQLGQVLTVLAVIATAVLTFRVPNAAPSSKRRKSLFDEERGALRTFTALVVSALAAAALMIIALIPTPAFAAAPQGVEWYGTPTITFTGAQLNVAVAGTGSGNVGVVSSATPAVCSVGNPGQSPAVWYPVTIKARGNCVLVGAVAAGRGYDAATATKVIPVWF